MAGTYKYCVVPCCTNSSRTMPQKIYVHIPRNKKIRKQWCEVMRRDKTLSELSSAYVCEDHFNLEEDMDNYMRWKLMSNISIRLKPGVFPHKFACQGRNIISTKRSFKTYAKTIPSGSTIFSPGLNLACQGSDVQTKRSSKTIPSCSTSFTSSPELNLACQGSDVRRKRSKKSGGIVFPSSLTNLASSEELHLALNTEMASKVNHKSYQTNLQLKYRSRQTQCRIKVDKSEKCVNTEIHGVSDTRSNMVEDIVDLILGTDLESVEDVEKMVDELIKVKTGGRCLKR